MDLTLTFFGLTVSISCFVFLHLGNDLAVSSLKQSNKLYCTYYNVLKRQV